MRHETRGERPTEPPEPEPMPVCPECGEECETLYRNSIGEIIGCDHCVDALDAYVWAEEHS